MPTVRRHLLIAGQVQGVYFRDSLRRLAVEHAVAGWVRNVPDGRVEAVLEGESEAVARLVAWAHHGPPEAVVSQVDVYDEPTEGLREFLVLPTPRRVGG
ncbi:MAG TPA: acylphosphatase [Micromonosporaceae bacterium]